MNLLPTASKIGAQRHLSAIRDGFVATLAITMVGSMAVLLTNLPWGISEKLMEIMPFWEKLNNTALWGTFSMFGMITVAAISYSLAKSYGDDGIQAPITALSAFLVFSHQSIGDTAAIPAADIDQSSLFTALIVSIVATEVYIRLCRSKRLTINLPEGVPPAVSRSFQKLMPGMLTVFIFAGLSIATYQWNGQIMLNDWINMMIGKPLQSATDTLGAAIVIPFLNQFLWFFGLHGSNILSPLTTPLTLSLLANNQAIVNGTAPAGAQYAVFAGGFLDQYVYMGGSGTTIGLLISIYLFSKSKHRREVANIGIVPAMFNINEPITFGMPMVLNPVFMIPFLLVSPILGGIAFMVCKTGLVGQQIVMAPWTSPPIIGAFIGTGGNVGAAILAAVLIALSIALWLPFVILADIQDKKAVDLEAAKQ